MWEENSHSEHLWSPDCLMEDLHILLLPEAKSTLRESLIWLYLSDFFWHFYEFAFRLGVNGENYKQLIEERGTYVYTVSSQGIKKVLADMYSIWMGLWRIFSMFYRYVGIIWFILEYFFLLYQSETTSNSTCFLFPRDRHTIYLTYATIQMFLDETWLPTAFPCQAAFPQPTNLYYYCTNKLIQFGQTHPTSFVTTDGKDVLTCNYMDQSPLKLLMR